MAMCEQPDRTCNRNRWKIDVPPCDLCNKLSLMDNLCYAATEWGMKPEEITDKENGNCGYFSYRSTRVG